MFDEWKKLHMNKLKLARAENLVDEDIGEMIDFLNSLKEYYTTSTCSGRITLITVPDSGRKDEAEFVGKKHSVQDADELWDTLNELVKRTNDEVWFRMEGLIMHIGCRTIEDANKLLAVVRIFGLKKSSLFSACRQFIVEVNGSEKIDAPVAVNGKVIVTRDYFNFLVKKANSKLNRVKKRNDEFFELLKQSF